MNENSWNEMENRQLSNNNQENWPETLRNPIYTQIGRAHV